MWFKWVEPGRLTSSDFLFTGAGKTTRLPLTTAGLCSSSPFSLSSFLPVTLLFCWCKYQTVLMTLLWSSPFPQPPQDLRGTMWPDTWGPSSSSFFFANVNWQQQQPFAATPHCGHTNSITQPVHYAVPPAVQRQAGGHLRPPWRLCPTQRLRPWRFLPAADWPEQRGGNLGAWRAVSCCCQGASLLGGPPQGRPRSPLLCIHLTSLSHTSKTPHTVCGFLDARSSWVVAIVKNWRQPVRNLKNRKATIWSSPGPVPVSIQDYWWTNQPAS